MLNEFVVPMGFSLKSWQAYRKKHKSSNKDYHKLHPKKKWKVVHGKKKGEVGKAIKGLNGISYDKATKAHTAIKLSEEKLMNKKELMQEQLIRLLVREMIEEALNINAFRLAVPEDPSRLAKFMKSLKSAVGIGGKKDKKGVKGPTIKDKKGVKGPTINGMLAIGKMRYEKDKETKTNKGGMEEVTYKIFHKSLVKVSQHYVKGDRAGLKTALKNFSIGTLYKDIVMTPSGDKSFSDTSIRGMALKMLILQMIKFACGFENLDEKIQDPLPAENSEDYTRNKEAHDLIARFLIPMAEVPDLEDEIASYK